MGDPEKEAVTDLLADNPEVISTGMNEATRAANRGRAPIRVVRGEPGRIAAVNLQAEPRTTAFQKAR